jgi:hypothetical protein
MGNFLQSHEVGFIRLKRSFRCKSQGEGAHALTVATHLYKAGWEVLCFPHTSLVTERYQVIDRCYMN